MLEPIAELEKCLARLPGLGRRSAQRAALALVRERERLALPLAAALARSSAEVKCCSECGAFTAANRELCPLCADPLRETGCLCVVEEPADIIALETTGAFRGRYHTLGGKLSPARRMGPEQLRIVELERRVAAGRVEEVLLALSTDMEGDATAGYIAERLKAKGVKVTRLAFGLPVDSGIAYSDPLTLRRAIVNRIEE